VHLKKVEKRDIVEAPLLKEAAERIKSYEELFQDFAQKVYEHSQIKERIRRNSTKKINTSSKSDRGRKFAGLYRMASGLLNERRLP